MPGTWQALTPWLQDLTRAPSPEVRLNVAMLAVDLAEVDADARTELARMLARTCDDMVLRGAFEDRLLFRKLAQERSRIPERQRNAVDQILRGELEKISDYWPPQRAVDVFFLEERAGILLPVRVLARAVEQDARDLSRASQGQSADRARARLEVVNRADTPERAVHWWRCDLRRHLGERFQSLPTAERRQALFFLLQVAPNLLEPVGGLSIAGGAELDAAARAGRPPLRWAVLCSSLTALALSIGLTLIVAMTVPLSSETEGLPESSSAWLFAILMVSIGFASGLIIGPFYTPSMGRRESRPRTLVRVAWPAQALYIAGTAALGLIALLTRDDGLPGVLVFLVVLDVCVVGASLLLPYIITLLGDRAQAFGVIFFSYAIAGPVVAGATAVCSFAAALHVTGLNEFWAPAILVATCSAVVITTIELRTLPMGQSGTAPIWSRGSLTLFAAVCYALVVIPASYALLAHKIKPDSNRITISSQGQITRTLDPERTITLVNESVDTLSIHFSAEDHKVVLSTDPSKALLDLPLPPKEKKTLCIDRCPSETWPNLDHWLPLLILRTSAINFSVDATLVRSGN